MNKKWIQENPKRRKNYLARWESENRERRLIQMKLRRSRPREKLAVRIGGQIRYALKKGIKAGRPWETLVGFTKYDLIKRLDDTMPDGYTWQDFLDGKLHVDHIIPVSVFNFKTPEDIDFKKCWSLENLQLLPAEENIRKYNKIERPFQPSLAFGGTYA